MQEIPRTDRMAVWVRAFGHIVAIAPMICCVIMVWWLKLQSIDPRTGLIIAPSWQEPPFGDPRLDLPFLLAWFCALMGVSTIAAGLWKIERVTIIEGVFALFAAFLVAAFYTVATF